MRCVDGTVGSFSADRIETPDPGRLALAVKSLDVELLSISTPRSACFIQVRLLFEVNSPYVVQYYDSFIDEGKLNSVMEYCDRKGKPATAAPCHPHHTR